MLPLQTGYITVTESGKEEWVLEGEGSPERRRPPQFLRLIGPRSSRDWRPRWFLRPATPRVSLLGWNDHHWVWVGGSGEGEGSEEEKGVISTDICTKVEPPNNGHIGTRRFGLHRVFKHNCKRAMCQRCCKSQHYMPISKTDKVYVYTMFGMSANDQGTAPTHINLHRPAFVWK